MATWPSTLPTTPLNTGYGFTPIDSTIRTNMDSGAPRVRRRTQARLDTVPVKFRFTDTQLNTFRTWFDVTTNSGTEWFTGMNLRLGDNGSLSTYSCRFVGVYKPEYIDSVTGWYVSGTLEVRNA